ncbi:hypothetical protein Efla_001286 [Eimeria flavescens]
MEVYEEQMKAAKDQMKLLSEPGAILPAGTVVAIKLTAAELQGFSRKLANRYSYRTNATSPDFDRDQPQSLRAEGNLPEVRSRQHEQPCQETPSLTGEVIEQTSGAGPLREGLRWTLARRARAAPAEYLCSPRTSSWSRRRMTWSVLADLVRCTGHSTSYFSAFSNKPFHLPTAFRISFTSHTTERVVGKVA